MFDVLSSLCAGFLILLFWGGGIHRFIGNFLKETFLWAPAVAALAMFSLVQVEPRYVGGFTILVWAAAFSALRIPEPGHAIIRSVTLTIVLLLGLQIILAFKKSIVERPAYSNPAVHCEVAQDLSREGIKSGDRVAFIGPAPWSHYWAHLSQVSIVSEVPEEGAAAFWAASPQLRSSVTTLFEQAGAKAVVARDVPSQFLAHGWKEVPHTNYYVLLLRRLGEAH